MKILLTAILTAVLGLGTGLGIAVVRLQLTPWNGDPGGNGDLYSALPDMPVPGTPLPQVVVPKTEFDFGTIDYHSKGTHDFLISNHGRGDLRLTAGGSSCRCTVSSFEKEVIPPGDSAKVTVQWKPNEDQVGPYRESVTVFTNDPAMAQVKLTVTGRVTVAARAIPPDLVLSRVAAGESTAAQTAVFGYLDKPLEITRVELTREAIAPHFDVQLEPLPVDRINEEPDAKSGFLVRVSLKPGLPLGPFEQTIRLKTNLDSVPEVAISVSGTIGRDITVVGRGWDAETGMLSFGTVRSSTGDQRRLLLIARGRHYKEVKFKLVHVDPDFLKVSLGETIEIAGGTASQTPLLVEIPQGSRRANHLGSRQGRPGEITLQTSHPDDPTLRIRVRFAVEG